MTMRYSNAPHTSLVSEARLAARRKCTGIVVYRSMCGVGKLHSGERIVDDESVFPGGRRVRHKLKADATSAVCEGIKLQQ